MKRQSLVCIALVALAATGCEYLLNPKNVFANLEADPSEKYSSMSAAETYDSLQRDKESPTFFDSLSNESAAAIQANLDTVIADAQSSGDSGTVINASLLKADIVLNTTPTGAVVNSVVDGLLSLADKENPSQAEVVASFLGPVSATSEAEFTDFLQNMRELAVVYTAVGNAVVPNVTALPPEVAQTATMALVIDAMYSAVEVPTGSTVETVLFAAMTAAFDNNDSTTPTVAFKTNSATLVTDTIAEGKTLDTILSAAGLGSFADLIRDLL